MHNQRNRDLWHNCKRNKKHSKPTPPKCEQKDLAKPNRTIRNLYLPNSITNAVLALELLPKAMWWYPLLRSIVEKTLAPFNFAYVVRRRGRLAPRQPLSVCALLPAYEENRHLRPLGNLGHRLRRPRWID